jgi:hypothetical protein
MNDQQLIEKLAAIEHERWAHWQKYLHSKLKSVKDGWLMSESDFEHWQSQIERKYDDLTEAEKDSDREQVARYFPLVQRAVATHSQSSVEEELEQLKIMIIELRTGEDFDPEEDNLTSDFDNAIGYIKDCILVREILTGPVGPTGVAGPPGKDGVL